MPPDPQMRASDADRDRVAAGLREHCAQGRLSLDELNERLDATYAAKTMGDLQQLTADLPEEDMYQLPVPARERPVPALRDAALPVRPGALAAWGSWAMASGITFTIWLIVGLTGDGFGNPWWLWVAGPWGVVLLVRQLFGSGRPHQR